jgi:hypothetical protein
LRSCNVTQNGRRAAAASVMMRSKRGIWVSSLIYTAWLWLGRDDVGLYICADGAAPINCATFLTLLIHISFLPLVIEWRNKWPPWMWTLMLYALAFNQHGKLNTDQRENENTKLCDKCEAALIFRPVVYLVIKEGQHFSYIEWLLTSNHHLCLYLFPHLM